MISIIIPVNNVEKYFRRCIESVIAQTYRDIEVILVDDGSDDGSGLLCDEYSKRYGYISVIHKEKNGPSDARNMGIAAAHGDHYAFVDSDDCISPHMMEILMDNLNVTDSDISMCRYRKVNYNDDILEKTGSNHLRTVDKDNLMKLLCNEDKGIEMAVVWNKLFKKEVFSDVRFPSGKYHEDQAVMHRLLYNCRRLVYTDDVLYYYMQREGSIMTMKVDRRLPDLYDAFIDRIDFLAVKGYTEESRFSYYALLNRMLGAAYYEHYDKPEGHCEKFKLIVGYIRNTMDKYSVYNDRDDKAVKDCNMLLENEHFFWAYRWCYINIFERLKKIK